MMKSVIHAACAVLAVNVALCQSGPGKLQFEVATVKPAALPTGRGAPRGGPGTADPERVHYNYVSVKNLLMSAYGLPVNRILGPPWIDEERYDIVAKVPPGATRDQLNLMLQDLLADRFRLMVHRETKEMPLYELVVGKNGPKIKPYVEDDPNAPKPEPGKPFAKDRDGKPIAGPGGFIISMSPGKRRVTASKQSIGGLSGLVTMLGAELGRPVVDKTGLTGEYDNTIEFRPEGPAAAAPPATDDSDVPDLLVAVQEQLGLRLEARKGPVEVLVVDAGEKSPTGN